MPQEGKVYLTINGVTGGPVHIGNAVTNPGASSPSIYVYHQERIVYGTYTGVVTLEPFVEEGELKEQIIVLDAKLVYTAQTGQPVLTFTPFTGTSGGGGAPPPPGN